MRKIILFILAFAMLVGSSTMAFAQGTALKMDNVGIQPGETAYISVTLAGEVTGDTIGISYSYDRSVLKVVTEACSWVKKGVLQDFAAGTDRGVWASSKSEAISGGICVLAFQVKPDADLSDAKVQCTLLVKNGSETVGEYTAEATISYICEHSFGEWTDDGSSGHSCTCEFCGAVMHEPHIWGAETYSDDPENPGYALKTKTCNSCSAVLTESTYIESDMLPTTPLTSEPEHTQPTYATNPNRQDEEEKPTEPTEPKNIIETPEPTQKPAQSTQDLEQDNKDRNEDSSGSQQETQSGNQSQKDYNDHREENLSNQYQETHDDQSYPNDEESVDDDHNHNHDADNVSGSAIEPGRNYHIHINEDGEHVIHYDDPEGTDTGEASGNNDDYHVHVDENGEYIIHYAEEGEACDALIVEGTDHDHAHEEEGGNGVTVAVVALAMVAMFGGAYWYLKKKR